MYVAINQSLLFFLKLGRDFSSDLKVFERFALPVRDEGMKIRKEETDTSIHQFQYL